MEPLVFYSNRLIMRQLEESDWPVFNELFGQSDVNFFISGDSQQEEARSRFEAGLNAEWQFYSGSSITLSIQTYEGDFVGIFVMCCQDHFCRRVEIGYMLANQHRGKGYAQETLATMIDWTCLRYGVRKFVGMCMSENHASYRVLEKCAFRREGFLHQHYRIGDRWADGYIMGLVTSERWRRFVEPENRT